MWILLKVNPQFVTSTGTIKVAILLGERGKKASSGENRMTRQQNETLNKCSL